MIYPDWKNKRVLRLLDDKEGTVIKQENDDSFPSKLVVQMDDQTKDEVYLYPWATPDPSRFMFLTFDRDCWINLNGHEHGWRSNVS